MSITTSSTIATTTTTSKSIDDMDAKELVEEAMKELQEIKRLLGISNNR